MPDSQSWPLPSSAWIFSQYRHRYWEEDEDVVGGETVTDLPVRNVYDPDRHWRTSH